MRNPTWTHPSPASPFQHGVELRTRADSTNICLPQALLSIVPTCAVSCISNFASLSYPGATCPNTSDLSYLCTQPNTSGHTIGEGSVQCIVSFCTGQEQADLDAYNVCDGIANSQPRTARTITATIFGSSTSTSSAMATLPASIGIPTSTEDVSTIVMATDSRMWVGMTSSPARTSETASSTSSGLAGPEATAGAANMSETATSSRGLTTAQIAGIVVGGVATAAIILGLLLLVLCMRRRRRDRRRSQRRSRVVEQMVEQTPPPNYPSPPKTSSSFNTNATTLIGPNAAGRFYSAPVPTDEKRRSFWRKSIRPEEIGVAVSPKMPGQESPVSASSEQSFSLLLPAIPAAALRPAPVGLETTRSRGAPGQRPSSVSTIFDEELDKETQQREQIIVDNQPFILEKPPLAKRPRGPPPNLRLPAVPESPARNTAEVRMPLTPTYDNGNILFTSPSRSIPSPEGSRGVLPVIEQQLLASSTYANRNLLRKNPPAKLPLRAFNSPPAEPLLQPRSAPRPPQARSATTSATARRSRVPVLQRESSVSSVYTEIEEDTTPEETNRQLGLTANPPTPSVFPTNMQNLLSSGQRSPIKDLRYPRIPRSAAVSRQADRPAQLRTSLALNSPPQRGQVVLPAAKPSRNELVRAQASFMQTDTTSSDGYMSDSTIEFPIPPTTRNRSTSLAQLKSDPSLGNRVPAGPKSRTFLNDTSSPETQTVNVAMPQRSPSTKARLTPSKSSTGDLYLTVEI